MIHICIATLGKQDNINRLCGYIFWDSIRRNVETVYILSQTAPILMRARAGLLIEFCPALLGCGGARQKMADTYVGAGLRPDDILVFLDDDIEVLDAGWLDKLIAPLFEGTSISGVEGRKLGKKMPVRNNKRFDYVSGGWCAMRGAVFLDGIRFDERYFPNYWEDADLCFEARKRGHTIACVGDVGLRHDESLKLGQAELLTRNRALFYEKWGLDHAD